MQLFHVGFLLAKDVDYLQQANEQGPTHSTESHNNDGGVSMLWIRRTYRVISNKDYHGDIARVNNYSLK